MDTIITSENSTGFIRQFEEAWRNASPQELTALLDDDVVLFQPHRPPIYGKNNAEKEFRCLFAWLPKLSGGIERYSSSGNTVFVELRLDIPVGKHTVPFRTVDILCLRDGKILERAAYFDRAQLVKIVLLHPPLWLGCARYLLK